ncbi:DUF4097 family beta strand repeat-containing protein [Bailinhaonella thermotolerans]|uniref:DUF4097 domain-containing protein n=1 Tax=Bailinhaonella thermotolerans TaxID=1070861 RepID=A0A3A4AJW8_9ACTN|nr:DUF4097 family beta strand repeat-containing protein [Bailinhaonella thermotolerans]RJL29946.1 hypothetical protein D5H75_23625 [Bailinhaonella thermotolerans]
MTTNAITRTFTETIGGPVRLALALPYGQARVTVTDSAQATITLTATKGSAAATAINEAAYSAEGGTLNLTVPGPTGGTVYGGSGVTVINSGPGVVISAGVITGGVTISGRGAVHISGTVTSGSEAQDRSLTAEIQLPRGSSLTMRTTAADLTTHGALHALDFTSVSGDLNADTAARLHAQTTSGQISAAATDYVTARSVSGDVLLGRAHEVTAKTNSGDITITAFSGTGQFQSVSGRISLYSAVPGSAPEGK